MKRPLHPEELRLWAGVARTVRPAPGRSVPDLEPEAAAKPPATRALPRAAEPPAKPKLRLSHAQLPEIEPGRRRRIARGRDIIETRLDLHGLDQDRARRVLGDFLHRAQEAGVRAVLVITGKGASGDGVLKRRTPEWLGDPALRSVVAGYSSAERRHGGDGAIYVALKRKSE